MATAEELLARSTGSDEKVCVIDWDTRVINIPKSITTLGVESDDNVKHLHFKMPKTYRGTDLSNFSIRINYMNANNDPAYFAPAKGVEVDDTNDVITFYWDVERDVVAYKGNVKFIVCLKRGDSSGVVEQELNTTLATLPVLEGLETDMYNIQVEPVDYLTQLLNVKNAYVDELENLGFKCTENLGEKHEELKAKLQDTATILAKTVAEPYRTRANAIVNTAEGSVISVNDASNDYLRGLRVFGKTTQVKTTGAQICNLPDITSMTSGGAIWTCKNGVVTVNGTTTGTSSTAGAIEFDMTGFVGTYTISGSTSHVSVYCAVTDASGNTTWHKDTSFSLTGNETRVVVYCQVSGANVLVNDVVYPMVNSGTSHKQWEPYSGGLTSPSPKKPSSLISLSDTNLKVFGKNLLQYPYAFSNPKTMGGVTFTDNGDGGIRVSGTPTEYAGISLTNDLMLDSDISIALLGTYENVTFDINLYVGNTPIGGFSSRTTATVYKDCYPENTRVTLSMKRGLNNIPMSGVVYPIVVTGTTIPTEYVRYIRPQQTTIPHTLSGIPVDSGGNYTDENDQQWICDEIDFERGAYVQRVNAYEVKGTENVNPSSDAWQRDGMFSMYLSGFVTEEFYSYDTSEMIGTCLSTHALSNGWEWKTKEQLTNVGFRRNMLYLSFENDVLGIVDGDTTDTKLSKAKAYLANQYANETPVIVWYTLATPIYHDLTESELAAYSALHSNYPTTTVMNDQGAHMELKYNADTQTVFENTLSKWVEVHFTVESANPDGTHVTLSCDKTYDEILVLLDNGQIPYIYGVFYGNAVCARFISCDDDRIVFASGTGATVTMTRDGSTHAIMKTYSQYEDMITLGKLPGMIDFIHGYEDGPLTAATTIYIINEKIDTRITKTLLWENPSPSSLFPSKTLVINGLDQYEEIEVEFSSYGAYAVDNGDHRIKIVIPAGLSPITGGPIRGIGSLVTTDLEIHRSFNTLESGIEFLPGFRDGKANSNYMIPIKIYGIKGIQRSVDQAE